MVLMRPLLALAAIAALTGTPVAAQSGTAAPPGTPVAAQSGTAAPARATASARGSAYRDPGNREMTRHAPPRFRAQFQTSVGNFTIAVTRKWAPRGADRFYNLVRTGYFDDQRFFRVRKGFIVQWGIHGDPEVSSAWKDVVMPDDPRVVSNTRGTVAYAFTRPYTRSTQIFISTGENSRLDAEGFAPFGKVVEGMSVVDRIYAEYDETSGGGMRGGNQAPIFKDGNAWFTANFPKLDRIVRATIVKP
jgi:cyclophilin family peptidyl-prolyl cis-trans isomerase